MVRQLLLASHCTGCPAAVANLWDVTDRDIDRFSQVLLDQWAGGQQGSRSSAVELAEGGGPAPAAQLHAPGRRGRGAEAAAVPAASSGHAAGGQGAGAGGAGGAAECIMSRAVGGSRQACRLPHLVGAAPVCYGVPVLVLPPRQQAG